MSAVPESPQAREFAAELGRRFNAVLVLVAMSNHGDGTIEQLGLDRTSFEGGRLGDDLSWLAATGLLRRESSAGSWDVFDPSAVYRLSAFGEAVANSLAALGRACGIVLPPAQTS